MATTTTASTPTPLSWRSDVLYPALALFAAVIIFSVTMWGAFNWSAKTTFGVSGGITTIVFTRHVLRRLGFHSRFITLLMYGMVLVTLWPLAGPYLGFHTNQALDERRQVADLKVRDGIGSPELGLRSALQAHKQARIDELTDEYDSALAAIRSNQDLTLEKKREQEQDVTAKYNAEVAAVSGLTVSDPKAGRIKRLVANVLQGAKETVKGLTTSSKSTSSLPSAPSVSSAPSAMAGVPTPATHVVWVEPQVPWHEGQEVLRLKVDDKKCYYRRMDALANRPYWYFPSRNGKPILVDRKMDFSHLPAGEHCYGAAPEYGEVTITVWPKNG